MVKNVLYITPDYNLDECLALMTKKHVRHLPVLDENSKVLAFLSIEDVVEAAIEDREFVISELTKYVTGSSFSEVKKINWDNVRELVFQRSNRRTGDVITA